MLVPSDAVADRAFGPRFTVSTQGDITIAANSIESCLDALPVCADVRNAVGGAIPGNNNNSRTMTWIDADGDPATFDSSSANLTLPTGASVLFAGLYYRGRLAAGSGGCLARRDPASDYPGETATRRTTNVGRSLEQEVQHGQWLTGRTCKEEMATHERGGNISPRLRGAVHDRRAVDVGQDGRHSRVR
ncbi:MAG TPA: hypothetical protein VFG93_07405 [Gaiellaceae bacterium]|nr:hypothetical protein [Gaiellaceae bacterium]